MSFFEAAEKTIKEKICLNCNQSFVITDNDLKFYHAVQVPEPRLCPSCRLKRKLAHINQINLFKRTCDATGENIITNYPPQSPLKVYKQQYWYSDAFDGTFFGRDFDFSRPFFEQYHELSQQVPRPALYTDFLHDENSAYTNFAGKNKNCYFIFDSDENWDCLYSYGMNSSRSSLDCLRVSHLELCYQCLDSKNCYNCRFTENSENCSDSLFLKNCISCRNCIMCSNLRQKEYHYLNKPIAKEEFEKIKSALKSYQFLQKSIMEFEQFASKFPQKYMQGIQNENVTGNYLMNSKNAIKCFDSMNIWDGKYLTQTFIKTKDCMDCNECGEAELCYESTSVGYNSYNIRFSLHCLNQITNLTYCNFCFHSSDLFGCIGLKGKKHCILNKQYTPEEYQSLVPKIIEHMQKNSQYGEFFPESLSDFPYHLTVASQYFPLPSDDNQPTKDYLPQTSTVPDSIEEVPDLITEQILACESCHKNYKIIDKELQLYRQLQMPIPRNCFHCRHLSRIAKRNPRQLIERCCANCKAALETALLPDRPEKVYCETCFQQSIA